MITGNQQIVQHITLTGDLGSGKSTVSKILADQLNRNRISTGDIQRQMAQELGISTLELNRLAEIDKSIDQRIDSIFTQLRFHTEPLIVDSRLAWHFLPHSFKVKLQVNQFVAAERILTDLDRQNEEYSDVTEALAGIRSRRKEEVERFKRTYGVDIETDDNFNAVIDTSLVTPEEIARKIYELSEQYWLAIRHDRLWISPQMLIPTKPILHLKSEKTQKLIQSIIEVGYLPANPVQLIKQADRYYVLDGHQRVHAALKQRISFVPVQMVSDAEMITQLGQSISEYINSNVSDKQLKEWLQLHNFEFPEFYAI